MARGASISSIFHRPTQNWEPVRRTSFFLLAVLGGIGWTIVFRAGSQETSAVCFSALDSTLGGFVARTRFALETGSLCEATMHWFGMVLAMTPMLLWRLLARQARRGVGPRQSALFLAGYIGVWTLAGAALGPLALSVVGIGDAVGLAPPLIAGVIALLWRCHNAPDCKQWLRAPRPGSDDASYWLGGVRYGLGCVGATWALMLLPITLHGDNRALMVAAMTLVAFEREAVFSLAAARTGKWQEIGRRQ